MNLWKALKVWDSFQKTVDRCVVKWLFTQIMDEKYEVALDVNSQKFLLRFSFEWWSICDFEILSAKWFVCDLTLNLVNSLRELVESLVC